MTDERFDRDLRLVLRSLAGAGPSDALRARLADVTVERPANGLARFAAPLRFAAVAAVAVAVIVLAVILVPRPVVGPAPSASAQPTATASPSVAELTPTAEPTPTVEPTPEPTAETSTWTSIAWAPPVEPLPYEPSASPGEPGTLTDIHNLVAWRGGFVGVGSVSHGSVCDEAAFFRSEDGVHWTVTQTISSGDQRIGTMCPDYVVTTSRGLLAIGQRRIWSSSDGTAWTEIDSPTWRASWTSDLTQLMSVASGPTGVVAIGTDPDRRVSIVAHSVDGRVWERVSLPANEQPIVRDVVSFAGGFVIGGRDGQPDDWNTSPGVVPGIGRPAAWFSSDGVRWSAAVVEGDRVQGGALTQLLVGAHGLFAVGVNTANGASRAGYPNTDYPAGDTVAAWTSKDGSSWQVAGALGRDLPPMAMLASDGTNMVGLGLRQYWVKQQPTGWTSTDGVHWTALAVSGPAPYVNYLVLEPRTTGYPADAAIWVFRTGILAQGAGDGVPTNPPYATQWFRVASARPETNR